jgi:hypothetical protein
MKIGLISLTPCSSFPSNSNSVNTEMTYNERSLYLLLVVPAALSMIAPLVCCQQAAGKRWFLWKLAALIRSISDTHEGTMIFWGYVVHSDSHSSVILQRWYLIMSILSASSVRQDFNNNPFYVQWSSINIYCLSLKCQCLLSNQTDSLSRK